MYLWPSDINYCQDSINIFFDKRCRHDGVKIGETLDDICEGRCKVDSIPTISVMKKDNIWVTADNRRLWVFRQLERLGKCEKIFVRETYSILEAKLTSINDGESVLVRGSPGGRWHKKHSKSTKTRTRTKAPTRQHTGHSGAVHTIGSSRTQPTSGVSNAYTYQPPTPSVMTVKNPKPHIQTTPSNSTYLSTYSPSASSSFSKSSSNYGSSTANYTTPTHYGQSSANYTTPTNYGQSSANYTTPTTYGQRSTHYDQSTANYNSSTYIPRSTYHNTTSAYNQNPTTQDTWARRNDAYSTLDDDTSSAKSSYVSTTPSRVQASSAKYKVSEKSSVTPAAKGILKNNTAYQTPMTENTRMAPGVSTNEAPTPRSSQSYTSRYTTTRSSPADNGCCVGCCVIL